MATIISSCCVCLIVDAFKKIDDIMYAMKREEETTEKRKSDGVNDISVILLLKFT